MKSIFILEWQKALGNRKNWFLVTLYLVLLLGFVLVNNQTFNDVRRQEALHVEVMRQNHEFVLSSYLRVPSSWGTWPNIEDLPSYAFDGRTMVTAVRAFYDERYIRMSDALEYSYLLGAAMAQNDRQQELYAFHNFDVILRDLYVESLSIWAFNLGIPHRFSDGFDVPMNLHERVPFHQTRADFSQHFIDNDILFIYESEMLGINYIYQAMRQLLPLAMLFIVFMAVSDVFNSDNQTGSYKFMLINPISRYRVFLAKLFSAFTIAAALLFVPLILVGLGVGIVNGFGPHNYPILVQEGSYATLGPLPNNLGLDRQMGFFTGVHHHLTIYNINFPTPFTSIGFAYVPEQIALGLTPYSSHIRYSNFFIPHPDIIMASMLNVILMAMPLFMLLVLVAVSVSALLSVISQRGLVTMIASILIASGVLFFPPPQADLSILARLNPYLYTNPINILNGLGSTTALTGVLVLLGWAVALIVAGLFVFGRQDVKC